MTTYEDPVLQALEERAKVYRADPEIQRETEAVLERIRQRRLRRTYKRFDRWTREFKEDE